MKSKLNDGKYMLFWLGTQKVVTVHHSNTGDAFFTTPTGMIHPIEDAAGAEFYPMQEYIRHADDFGLQKKLLMNRPPIDPGVDPIWKWIAILGWITVAILTFISAK